MISGEKDIKDIIERAIKGESSAFGLLYDKYQPQIYRFIYLKVSHREEAEDLCHQVFLKTWQNIAEYKFQGFPFSSWLYRVARNQVIDYYRIKKNNISIENEAVLELNTENLTSKIIDQNLDIEKIKKAINNLNPAQQDVLILRFIESFSVKETASILKKTEIAIKLLQHRAIKNLRKIMRIANNANSNSK